MTAAATDRSFVWQSSVVTEPTAEPVALDEMKSQLRITFSDDDLHIGKLIRAARIWCERFTQLTLCTTVRRATACEFPGWTICLPYPPLFSVASIQYVDTVGATQTFASANYIVNTYAVPGEITPAYNQSWPSTREQANAVTIQYTAGFGAPAAVPETIKHAIKLLVTDWYFQNRGDETATEVNHSLEMAVRNLLSTYAWRMYS